MNCKLKGLSGEHGCFQYMPATWNAHAKRILGYVPRFNDINEKYVAVKIIEKRLAAGLTPKQIALEWNSGMHHTCISGINKFGVAYNSCAYPEKFMRYYNR
jgi:hypothetical protein